MFIKICGITRLSDADLAAELGAAAIGFIFWPGSPRCIAPEDARAIVRRKASALATVGVFVNEPVERVREVMEMVGLDVAQLHGAESPEYCRQLGTPDLEAQSRTVTLIKAVGVKDDGAVEVKEFDSNIVLLLDAHDPLRHGGTGRTLNWDAARHIAASRRTILSGGLTAENVRQAVAAVEPYGIDVSSGVESAPGVKDRGRMTKFFGALND
jgi:phosphoribosylanthranilate isomerase